MARITVEDCLEKVPNRFALIVLATERARQLAKGSRSLVDSHNKSCVTALREIAGGRVRFNENVPDVVRTFIAETKARHLETGPGTAGARADRRSAGRSAKITP